MKETFTSPPAFSGGNANERQFCLVRIAQDLSIINGFNIFGEFLDEDNRFIQGSDVTQHLQRVITLTDKLPHEEEFLKLCARAGVDESLILNTESKRKYRSILRGGTPPKQKEANNVGENDDDDSPPPPPPPTGPSSARRETEDSSSPGEGPSNQSPPPPPPPTKRGRGRPRKNPPNVQKGIIREAITKRKRGRPKKSRTTIQVVNGSDADVSGDELKDYTYDHPRVDTSKHSTYEQNALREIFKKDEDIDGSVRERGIKRKRAQPRSRTPDSSTRRSLPRKKLPYPKQKRDEFLAKMAEIKKENRILKTKIRQKRKPKQVLFRKITGTPFKFDWDPVGEVYTPFKARGESVSKIRRKNSQSSQSSQAEEKRIIDVLKKMRHVNMNTVSNEDLFKAIYPNISPRKSPAKSRTPQRRWGNTAEQDAEEDEEERRAFQALADMKKYFQDKNQEVEKAEDALVTLTPKSKPQRRRVSPGTPGFFNKWSPGF